MNGRRSAWAQRLTTVAEGSPGARMGLQAGDLIVKINNRPFRDDAAMVTALDRQRVGQSWTVTVMRGDQESTLSGVAEGRPTITLLIRPTDILPGETATGMQVAAAAMGGLEPAIAAYAAANPDWHRPQPVAAVVPPAPETALERIRREAAEAQARLAAAESAAAKAPTP